jgi:hypothetical protein
VGIRARLTIGMAILLLVGFALLGIVVVQTTNAALIEQVDTRIWAAKSRMEPHDGPANRGGPRDERGARGHPRDANRERGQPDGQEAPRAAGDRADELQLSLTDGAVITEIPATPSAAPGAPGTDEDVYERPIARLVYAPDGTLLNFDPSGYPDAPDPPPVLPALSGAGLAWIEGRITTMPATGG